MDHEAESRDKEKSNVPLWRKFLHWPIVCGREMLWGCMAASGVPLMTSLGVAENVAASVTAISGICAIFLVINIAYFSDRCELNIGRRRPFIILLAVIIFIGGILELGSSCIQFPIVLRQIMLCAGIIVQDFSLCALDTPLLSYTMDVFNEKDRVQVMAGNGAFGGAGGLLGFYITSLIPLYALSIAASLYVVFSILNVFSMKETPLKVLREEGKMPELHDLKTTLRGYITAPTCMKKLQLSMFLNWNSLIGIWIFFTKMYAVAISNTDLVENDFESIHTDFNGTTYSSTSEMLSLTNMNESTIIETQSKYLYVNGLNSGAKIMMLYPIAAISFSSLFTIFKVFEKVNLRILYMTSYLMFVPCAIMLLIYPAKIVFIFLSITTGYFTVMFYSIPFMLIDLYRTRQDYPKERGLAGDCSLLTIAASTGQVMGSLVLTGLLLLSPAEIVVPYYAMTSGIAGLFVVVFMIEYANPKENHKEENDPLSSQ